jgi:choline kinase
MRGLILAAGRGRRLQGVIGNHPKCLARVGAHALIERQLTALRECGITAITVVAGYGASEVRRVCGSQVDIVHNPRFASTNSLYSFWLARDRLRDGVVVLNADVLFHRQLLVDLMTARYEDALLLGAPADGAQYSDEEMKVCVRASRVVEIAKTIDPLAADGENVGIVKFGRTGAALLVEEADRLIAAGAVRDWFPSALAAFSRRRPLHVVESRGFPWIEIDCPEDYWRACSEVLGAIDALAESRPASAAARTAAFHSRRTAHHV